EYYCWLYYNGVQGLF
nr:immunoglobulin light chain junction region [Macaca mulatta]